MHRVIGGLQPLKPGWKSFLVRPIPGGDLSYAKVKYLSPFGLIEVEWHMKDQADNEKKVFSLMVVIPQNSTARIEFPQQCHATVNVGSGKYQYEALYTPPEWPILPSSFSLLKLERRSYRNRTTWTT